MNKKKSLLLAKSADEDGNHVTLNLHLIDVAGTIRKMISEWVADSTITATGLCEETVEKIAVFIAAIHDIGKAVSFFQQLLVLKDPKYRQKLTDAGILLKESYNGKTNHAWTGHDILKKLGINNTFAAVCGAHHGIPYQPSGNNIARNRSLIDLWPDNIYGSIHPPEDVKKTFEDEWINILEAALEYSGLSPEEAEKVNLSVEAQNIIAGIVICADWIASNKECFPYTEDDLTPEEIKIRIETGWDIADLPKKFHAETFFMTENDFINRFGFQPNSMQKAVIDIVNSARKPGLYLLNIPTGLGKTEAALAMTEILCARFGCGGSFCGLPSQATANGIFERYSGWAESLAKDTKVKSTIRLAHGATALNDNYAKYASTNDADEDGLIINPWFSGNHKTLLSDFIVGTVDQMLMMSLKKKYYMLKHLGLTGKVVIIDECHAYSAHMGEYIEESLSWCGAYGIPVILLSATLQQAKRVSFIEAYKKSFMKYSAIGPDDEIFEQEEWRTSLGYPSITWTEGGSVYQKDIEIPNDIKKEITLIREDEENIVEILNDKLSDGGCAAIITNTVKKAQEVKSRLKAAFSDKKIFLYHSRFTSSARARKEALILNMLGKRSNNRNGIILIGTQVLEQSLDYDVDIMISQICPIDLLVQRIGRLFRHSVHDPQRPEKLKRPTCYIFNADKGTKMVYCKYLTNMTEKILPDKILIPNDTPGLIEAVYGTEDKTVDGYEEYLKKIKDEKALAKRHTLSRRNVKNKLIDEILSSEYEELDDSQAEASVRGGDPNIEVILLKDLGNGNMGIYDNDKFTLSVNGIPSTQEALILLHETIKLPHSYKAKYEDRINVLQDKANTLLPAWKDSPWLKDRLFLIMNQNNTVSICGEEMIYNDEDGLIIS